jgi:hypothetical protein
VPVLLIASELGLGALLRAYTRVVGVDHERGDVPGWVMITIMTAGLVLALWGVAGPQLNSIFTNALNSVVGGP